MQRRPSLITFVVAITALPFLAGCGGGGEKPAVDTTTTPPAPPAVTGQLTPTAGHKVINVELITDDKGNNRFVPSDITAEQGDVLRFTLGTGVHNVDFVADSNKSVTPPPPADMLQLPGQTHDFAVSWPSGRYFFQCDPHALLGMVGHLTVK